MNYKAMRYARDNNAPKKEKNAPFAEPESVGANWEK
jgi:hypothetical protein